MEQKTEKRPDINDWLPTTKKQAHARGWRELDVIVISGDAYVDHPSFGASVISRLIEKMGLKVAIIAQPNWRDDLRDFTKFGAPRFFFAVASGAMDPMVNHYTARKRKRDNDAYSPGAKAGFRPDHATVVYSKILKKLYPDSPVVIGGIEASLRRLTHYDYWSDSLKPSILVDSGADLLVYGMGEQPIAEIIKLLLKGVAFSSLKTTPQTAFTLPTNATPPKRKGWKAYALPSHEACQKDKHIFADSFKRIEAESNKEHPGRLTQQAADRQIVINPHFKTMTQQQIDASFNLPYTRLPHPKYEKRGVIPAYEMIRFSVNLHRGCFGGCSFCAISAHQGKKIISRSKRSILDEVEKIKKTPYFKGYISDLGGPSANMYRMAGNDTSICDSCARASCVYPKICFNLNTDHQPLIDIYREVSALDGIKKAFVSSGVRYDLFLDDDPDEKNSHSAYAKQLILHHVSGRLKVAPEHTSERVLKAMRKPSYRFFEQFRQIFDDVCKKHGLKQQIIPYFISGHPGCELEDMAGLALKTKEGAFRLEQAQDFTPTPMTLASVMFYTGYDPYSKKKLHSAKTIKEKKAQSAFLFWYKKEHIHTIKHMLTSINRADLINRIFSKKPYKPNSVRHKKKGGGHQ